LVTAVAVAARRRFAKSAMRSERRSMWGGSAQVARRRAMVDSKSWGNVSMQYGV
jgi:hypothetical protein